MTTQIIRPDSEVSSGWFYPLTPTVHYNVIDDDITYPTIGGYSGDRYISDNGYTGSDNSIDDFHFEDLSGVTEVESIKIYTIGSIWKFTETSYFPELQYSINGGASWSAVHDCIGHGIGSYPSTHDWQYDIWEINDLSWTQAQINAIRVRCIADVPGGDKENSDANVICVIYIAVTHDSVGEGYPHKVLGVEPASIGKVLGVEAASIGKVLGVE